MILHFLHPRFHLILMLAFYYSPEAAFISQGAARHCQLSYLKITEYQYLCRFHRNQVHYTQQIR